MSHTTSIKAVKIQSLSALQAAVAEMNQQGIRCSLEQNATPRAYFQNQQGLGQADYVLRLADAAYDVGLYKQEDGSLEARTDFYDPSHRGQGTAVEKILGTPVLDQARAQQAKLGKLFQLYGVHATAEIARKKGHSVRRIVKADGTIALELTGANL